MMKEHHFFLEDSGEDREFEREEWLAVVLAAVLCAVITALAMPWPV